MPYHQAHIVGAAHGSLRSILKLPAFHAAVPLDSDNQVIPSCQNCANWEDSLVLSLDGGGRRFEVNGVGLAGRKQSGRDRQHSFAK